MFSRRRLGLNGVRSLLNNLHSIPSYHIFLGGQNHSFDDKFPCHRTVILVALHAEFQSILHYNHLYQISLSYFTFCSRYCLDWSKKKENIFDDLLCNLLITFQLYKKSMSTMKQGILSFIKINNKRITNLFVHVCNFSSYTDGNWLYNCKMKLLEKLESMWDSVWKEFKV